MGAGWVGLVTGACFAELGHRVVVRDVAAARIDDLRNGRAPVYEPGLSDLLARNRERMTFTTDASDVLSAASIVFICVGTPATDSGDADLSAVWSVVDDLEAGDDRTILVMKSTVPVGTGERVRIRLAARGLDHVDYVSNPEFLAEGSALQDFMNPDRVVVGALSDGPADVVAALYEPLGARVLRTDVASAEMIKYASNAFLATKISFINEISNVCEQTGADVAVVAEGMGMDQRIGPAFLRAGIGFGGSCFPKDVSALKQLAGNSGYHFQLLHSVIEVNELQKRRIVSKLSRYLGSLRDREIALLGVAFKPHTDDVREAPSLTIMSRLIAEGARVRAWDPVALDAVRGHVPDGVLLVPDVLEAVDGADAAVVVTEWPELRELDLGTLRDRMAYPLIVDGRNLFDPAEARRAGLVYEGVGRPLSEVEMARRRRIPGLSPALTEADLAQARTG